MRRLSCPVGPVARWSSRESDRDGVVDIKQIRKSLVVFYNSLRKTRKMTDQKTRIPPGSIHSVR